ncbi:MAG TPA: SDR family oxidoreductase, partial [Ktedonobacteraceae bacterium]|nr:SDR family oxidoreductase [Ktedonobacteraceae bacterium]
LQAPRLPYLSNVTGSWITEQQATDPAYWSEHLCQTVRFADGVGTLLAEPDYLLVEVGPGFSLSSFVRQHPACGSERMKDVFSTLPTAYDQQSDQASLLTMLGKLWLMGAPIDWHALYAGERRHRVLLPTYPFERQRYWLSLSPKGPKSPVAPSATTLITRKEDITDWFYQPVWEAVPLSSTRPSVLLQRPILLFEDIYGVGEQLAQQLMQKGHTVVRVQQGEQFIRHHDQLFSLRPGQAEDYQALYNELKTSGPLPGTILHGWSLSRGDETEYGPEYFRKCQETGFYSLVFLTQALAALFDDTPVQVLVISNGLQSVTGQENIHPEKATLLGACTVISQEHPHILCRSIDIEVGEVGLESTPMIEALLAEATLAAFEPVIAYRSGQRWIQTYQPRSLEAPATSPFRQSGVYLITGGLGGIGLVLAEYLARTAQARLILTGRTALPGRAEWGDWLESHEAEDTVSTIIRRIQSIEALGAEVLVQAVDVSDEIQMQEVVRQALAAFGTLHGAFHLAGITSGAAFQPIPDMSRKECEMHFQAKVYGTFALEKALEGLPLDFCLLFSSLSSVLGGLGFVGYASGNIFLDAFTLRHNQTSSVSWQSVNWDTWQVKEDAHGVLGATIAAFAMQPTEALDALTRVMGLSPRLVNSTGDLQQRLRQWIRLEVLRASNGAELEQQVTRHAVVASAQPASGDYEQTIIGIWQQVLGVEQVGLYDNFFDLGGNSLIGLQLIARLKKAFQTQIPAVILFEAPTVSAQVKYLQPAPELTLSSQESQQQILAKRRQQARKTDS